MRPERAFAGTIAMAIAVAGASTAYASGNVCLGTAFVVFGGVALLLTLAKWLPLLNRLPLVGAIRPPKLEFRLEAPRGGMVFDMDPGAEARVLLYVGVLEGRRDEITRVMVNVSVIGATLIVRTEQNGASYRDGGRMLTNPDGAPYWAINSLTIPLGAFVMFFKVTMPAPGEYPVVVTLQSPDFYNKGDHRYESTLVARSAGDT